MCVASVLLLLNVGQYYQNRDAILDGADHSYQFCPVILGVNRQIRHEAGDLFHRENLFIRFTIEKFALCNIDFKQHRLPIIASGDTACRFPFTAMSLTFDASEDERRSWVTPGTANRDHEYYIFHIDDLTTLCTSLLLFCGHYGHSLRTTPLQINMNTRREHISAEEEAGFPTLRSRIARLLEPLRQLHDFEVVDIAGPGSPAYKADIVKSIRGRRASPAEIIEKGSASLDRGNYLYSEAKLSLAMDMYKSGLNVIQGSCFDSQEDDEILNTGDYKGCVANRARDDVGIRLHARIANIYFVNSQHRMARIYAERGYGPAHSWDHRQLRFEKFPLCLSTDRGAFPASYAEVLAVAARISDAQGNVFEAFWEISEAVTLDPLSEEIKSLFDKYEKQAHLLRSKREHRQKAQMLEEAKLLGKVSDEIKVAAYREGKADQAFRIGNLLTARSCYEGSIATLSKTSKMRDRFYWCLPYDLFHPREGQIHVSMIRLHSKLTLVCLRLKANEDVCSRAEVGHGVLEVWGSEPGRSL